jgi:hypothetical protein
VLDAPWPTARPPPRPRRSRHQAERADSPLAWVSPAVASVALAHGLLGHDDEFRLWRTRAEHVAGNVRFRYLASYAAFVDARVALHTGQTDNADVLTERAFADFPRKDWYRAFAHAAGAELAVASRLPDAADRLALEHTDTLRLTVDTRG